MLGAALVRVHDHCGIPTEYLRAHGVPATGFVSRVGSADGWLSALAYAVYNYAIYVFGSEFNDLFLVHVALFSLSVFALALALANLDVVTVAAGFRAGTPVRSVSVLLLLPAIGLGAMWVFYSLRFAFTGTAPEESLLVLPSASVHLGYVLDLALLVPGYALAGVLLWRRAPWGYVMAVFGTVYQLS